MGYVSMMPDRVELILWEEVWIHMYNDTLTQLWAKYFVTFPCVVGFGLPSAILALTGLEQDSKWAEGLATGHRVFIER